MPRNGAPTGCASGSRSLHSRSSCSPPIIRKPCASRARSPAYVEAVRALGGNGRALAAGVNAEKLIPDIGRRLAARGTSAEGAAHERQAGDDGSGVSIRPRTAGSVVKAHNFGDLVGPIWRKGDALFGFVDRATSIATIAASLHGGMLMSFADQAMGMTGRRAHRRQAPRHHRDEHAVHRRSEARRFRRGALRSGARDAFGAVHGVQAESRHAHRRLGERDLEDFGGGVALRPVTLRRPRSGASKGDGLGRASFEARFARTSG